MDTWSQHALSLLRPLTPQALAAVRRAAGAGALGNVPVPPGPDSAHHTAGRFRNSEPASVVEGGSRLSLARDLVTKGRTGRPAHPVPLVRPDWAGRPADQPAGENAAEAAEPAARPAARCAATWLGHATVLLEVGGHWVLTDPVWSERCSPSPDVGPRRLHPVPVDLAELPPLSAVLISHDHYDHLDTATVDALVRAGDVPFVVPLGVDAHLRGWGVPAERVVELDWGQRHLVAPDGPDRTDPPDGPDVAVGGGGTARGPLELTCVEARHFSGRFTTENPTLWSAWLVSAGGIAADHADPDHTDPAADTGPADHRAPTARVLVGGDTGYTPALGRAAAAAGPIDLAVLPIGAYDRRWPDIHLDPEEAVRIHLESGAEVLMPIHWATFDLAFHPWAEPAERVRAAAAADGVRLAQPRPGERVVVEPGAPLPTREWWRRPGEA